MSFSQNDSHPSPEKKKAHAKNGVPIPLLNVINGVEPPEGCVLIMTTNHLESLADAFTQPSRVDVKAEFQSTDEKIMAHISCIIFKHLEGDNPDLAIRDEGGDPGPGKSIGGDDSLGEDGLRYLAKQPSSE